MFTWKSASCHNGVQFFSFHLARWLRTRRFSEPTFRPSGAPKHWKTHSVSRLFYPFTHQHLFSSDSFSSLIFFLLLFSDSSHLCFFICPYCRKFDFYTSFDQVDVIVLGMWSVLASLFFVVWGNDEKGLGLTSLCGHVSQDLHHHRHRHHHHHHHRHRHRQRHLLLFFFLIFIFIVITHHSSLTAHYSPPLSSGSSSSSAVAAAPAAATPPRSPQSQKSPRTPRSHGGGHYQHLSIRVSSTTFLYRLSRSIFIYLYLSKSIYV